ncbi:retrotransposon protein, putative, ty1-copia subclass [Tanacetum coccineum]
MEISRGCNASFVTMIPKVADPIGLGDYRPISLIGCYYKIIAKMLAERVKRVVGDVVGEVQNAFIKGRYILDGVLIANQPAFSILPPFRPSEEFGLERGVRQGDPLSPFLFILAAEGLNAIVSKAVEKGIFRGVVVGDNNVMVPHLQYADDTIFFGDWDKDNAKSLMCILKCFEEASGLKVNYNKSKIYGIGINDEEMTEMARWMGCGIGDFPFTNLGLPIGENMRRVKAWGPANIDLYIKDALLKGFLEQVPRDSIRNSNVEVVQHGACLGLGLAALGTADEDIYDEIKTVLYTDSVVAGEASRISIDDDGPTNSVTCPSQNPPWSNISKLVQITYAYMGKTIGEIHAMLIEYEKGLLKKAETPQVLMIKVLRMIACPPTVGGRTIGKGNVLCILTELQKERQAIENQLGKTIKAIRSDRGGEYISQEFKDYLKANGIVQQLTPPYTPQHNGVSERRNRTLLDMVRSMMNLTTLPLSFWDYALESATRILNMVPTKKVDKTPYELWYGKVPNLSYLKVWGCEALVKRDTPDKLEQRSVKCIFIGYPKETMGYYFYFPPENKIVVARYAEFFEKRLISQEISGRAVDLEEIQEEEDTTPSEITSNIPQEVEGFEPPQEEVIPIRRSERTHRAPNRLCLNVEVEEHSLGDLNEPTSYKAAMLDSESNKWIDAMNAEIQSMMDNMVWVLVDLPPGCKTVGSKWLFKKKTDMDGIVYVYKAHLVAKGYSQLYGVDYEETFSHVADIRAIRILISIAAYYDYEIWQMDVKTAFLNGYLDEDIYMVQPEGFVDPNHPRKVCKLQRFIYGLKQASRSWNKRFDEEIKRFGFAQNLDEPCVYQKASGSNVTFLILYVDDIIIMGNHIPSLRSVKDYLGKCFAMKDLGEAAFILRIKIYRDRSKRLIGLSQNAYMDKILKRYKMDNSKRGHIPMQERLDLNKSQGAQTPKEVNRMKNVPYASAVGSIMYAVRCTRPDVAFAQNMTSRFQQNPGEPHWTAVKNILKYLRNTKDMFLVYGGNPSTELRVECYCDAGFETDRDDTKSQTRYIFVLNGGALDWKSSKQSTTAMSATESEYIAASEAAMKGVWIRKFISGIGIVPTINEPLNMYCDNSAAVHYANELGVQKGARHYQRRYHYVRECVELGEIRILKVHTDNNLADPFTKALSNRKLTQHAKGIGLRLASSFM